ncbi:MAG: ABC transporter [Thermobacillus sp. ZCTH02-B1]|uniref:ABC transporter permease n=1 Tax=Thermobacillus sp. ZCTH02-B1 TaxID=1858795 RepID=UPI000B55E2F8|nr:ABC transporter permease [Thermobacillus sp. ZCTH02-B1]OUM95614.1 MAG: ABC transporter [Thermobacillus sp. ZCTH02-B1]
MSIRESILVALDNLRVNKMRSFLTMIGIVFGVAAVVTVVSIGQAGQHAIMAELSNYGDGYFLIYPKGSAAEEGNPFFRLRELAEIRKLPGVRYVSTSQTFGMTGRHKKETLQFKVTGTTSDSPRMKKIDMVAGRFFTSQEERARQKVLVVETKFADKAFGSPQAAIGRSVQLSGGVFRIVGVYKEQEGLMVNVGARYSAYAPITAIPGGAWVSENLSMLEILPASPERMDETIRELKTWLAERKRVSKNAYATESAKDAEQMIKNTFSILQLVIGSIAGISLVVGGIGVMNIMLVSVTERTREIGIRKAIGATPGNIMFQFLVEAVMLSFIGGAIGALFGLLVAFGFAVMTGLPFVVSMEAIVLAFCFSAAVGIFFGLYPARKAAKLQPIESLRYE